jgi:hypothetical protein
LSRDIILVAQHTITLGCSSLTLTMSTTKDPELAKNDLEVTSSVSSSSKHAAAPVPREGETVHLPNFEHEKALCWKFDLRMLPMLALMYLFNARIPDPI